MTEMAMTKAEKARLDELENQLRIAKAFRFTDEVRPDVMPPARSNDLAKGFLFNDYTREVAVACTSSVYHAYGQDDRTTTQRARCLYSTRLRALRALRHSVEKIVSEQLAEIDREIEAEQAKPT
jgi:hypothetical protein